MVNLVRRTFGGVVSESELVVSLPGGYLMPGSIIQGTQVGQALVFDGWSSLELCLAVGTYI